MRDNPKNKTCYESERHYENGLCHGAAAVVLAAGAGKRFLGGSHKLLAELDGVPLVRRAVDSARSAGCKETIVVMGAVDILSVLPDDVTVLQNEDWKQGQATSLVAAVNYAGSRGYRAVVCGLGDQPGIPSSTWAAICQCDHDLVVAEYQGVRCPPVRIGAPLWSYLQLTGDFGARVLMRRWPDLVKSVSCEGDPRDIDTLQDLMEWTNMKNINKWA